MIIGVGTDIIEIKRIQKASFQNNFLAKYFTEEENNFFIKKRKSPNSIAGNFAAKEAVAKSLGTGFRNFSPIDIEVLRDEKGAPYIKLYNNAKLLAEQKQISQIYISISHCIEYATAYAIAEK